MKTEIFSAADPVTLLEDELFDVLNGARTDEGAERRATTRHPCFAPVSLTPSGEPRQVLSAFSRDLSRDGMGLLHNMPIPRGAIYRVQMRYPSGALRQFAQVMWCRPAGEGWFLSGWRFVKAVP